MPHTAPYPRVVSMLMPARVELDVIALEQCFQFCVGDDLALPPVGDWIKRKVAKGDLERVVTRLRQLSLDPVILLAGERSNAGGIESEKECSLERERVPQREVAVVDEAQTGAMRRPLAHVLGAFSGKSR
jgi:hypothetical protein